MCFISAQLWFWLWLERCVDAIDYVDYVNLSICVECDDNGLPGRTRDWERWRLQGWQGKMEREVENFEFRSRTASEKRKKKLFH